MPPLFIDPGLFRRRASLLVSEPVSDGAGGHVPAWREVAEVSVHVEPVSVTAAERFDQGGATVTHRVTCRARGDVDRGMRLLIGQRVLRIRSVYDPDETGRFLVCRCQEET